MRTFHRLNAKSISSRLYRSIGLVMIGLILSYAMVMISLIAVGMKHGNNNVVERMGADLIVVPKEHGEELEGILLTTQKSYFYMDDAIIDQMKEIDGIDEVSPQTFLMTLEASCCDQAVQIIGIDIESDFTVTPWIEKKYMESLKYGEIIVGSGIGIRKDNTFQMFGKSYNVAAVLDESGSSMDGTVFVSRDVINDLIQDARLAGQGIVAEIESGDISAAMIKVDDEESIQSVVAKLSGISGIDIVTADSVTSRLSAGLRKTYVIYAIVLFLLFLISVLLLFIIHYITINEKKAEVEILRIIGVSRKEVKTILTEEVFFTSFLGAVSGISFGFLSFRLLFEFIDKTTEIPFAIPSINEELIVIFVSFLFTTILGPLCAAISIRKVCPKDILE